MEEQRGDDIVEPLHVSKLQVIDAICDEHLSQHFPENALPIESGTAYVGTMYVLIDLCHILR